MQCIAKQKIAMRVNCKHGFDMRVQGISCSKGQCGEVMLKDSQPGSVAEVFKCVGCANTVTARNVDGSGPLDVEKQADDLYKHAVGVLQQQVRAPRHISFLSLSLFFCGQFLCKFSPL